MKTFLFIVAVILWVGVKFLKTSANKAANLEDSSTSASRETSSQKSAFESLFDEFMGETEPEPAAEEEYQWMDAYPFDESASDEEAVPNMAQESAEVVNETESAETIDVEADDDFRFDLRQAVIYQTILNNKYLSEVPSQDN